MSFAYMHVVENGGQKVKKKNHIEKNRRKIDKYLLPIPGLVIHITVHNKGIKSKSFRDVPNDISNAAMA